jgi:probable phosphoglycerate mutase
MGASPTRIFVLRHGETELNRRGVLQGRQDAPLTDAGVGHAEAMGRWLAATGLVRATIWSSPLRRTVATAEGMLRAAGREAEIRIHVRLIEVDGGRFERLTRDEVVRRTPGALADDVLLLLAPDAEPYVAVANRLATWLADVGAEGGDHVAITHAGAGRILRALYLGLGRESLAAMEAPHATVFRLQDGREERL